MLAQIQKLKAFYQDYAGADLDALRQIYHASVTFEDPLHVIEGRESLRQYFEAGRQGLNFCRFSFHDQIVSNDRVVLEWEMLFAHRRLNKGKIIVRGCSILSYCLDKQLVVRHKDYFDLGNMLYEHIPVLGSMVRIVKTKAVGG